MSSHSEQTMSFTKWCLDHTDPGGGFSTEYRLGWAHAMIAAASTAPSPVVIVGRRNGKPLCDVVARMRERRQALGLTQTAFAAAIGMTQPMITRYEQGLTPSSKSRARIEGWLDTTTSELPNEGNSASGETQT